MKKDAWGFHRQRCPAYPSYDAARFPGVVVDHKGQVREEPRGSVRDGHSRIP